MTDHVRRSGTIFRCGDYPDKSFSLTPDEAATAIAAFRPVPVDLEHTSTVLDGRLGTLESVAMGEDGTSLVGTVALPAWLDALLDEGQRKVSATWDRATKQLRGLAIVNTPRVADAALMAAFAATDEGKALVAIESEFAGKRHSKADQDTVQAVHDHSVSLGAACPASARMSAKEQGMTDEQQVTTTPTRMERFMAWLGGEGASDAEFAASPTTTAIVAPDPEKEQMRQRLEAIERERVAEKAAAFADGEILAGRAYPAERAALIAAFAEAADDDRTSPRTVTFAVGEETRQGSRVEALVARQTARTPHALTEERLADARVVPSAAPDTGAPAKMSAERKAHLTALAGVNFTAQQ
jgi:hypothetical protein